MNKKPKVIIIGNSPIVLDNDYGSRIDSYDIVIRINHCPTIGFENNISVLFSIISNNFKCFFFTFFRNNSN